MANLPLVSKFRDYALESLASFQRQYDEVRKQEGLVGEQYIFVDESGLLAYQVSGSCSRPSPSFMMATLFSIEVAERIVEKVESNRGHTLKIMKQETALSCAIMILEEMIANYDRTLTPKEIE